MTKTQKNLVIMRNSLPIVIVNRNIIYQIKCKKLYLIITIVWFNFKKTIIIQIT